MKKILIFVLGLVALLAAAVVVLPGFIDWNDYKTGIQAQLKGLTGRNVVIGGDIHITVLPTPAVVANNVRLANVKGASAADMVRLKSMEVRIALGPLLAGNVQVETVKLVDPIVELERLADGRVNWEFTPVRTAADGSTSVPLPGEAASPFPGGGEGTAIRLDSFHIENGTIIYRDAVSGSSERFEHLDARLSADSLIGPLDSVGKFDFRGVSLAYELAIGRIINERTVPINMVLSTPPGGTKIEISGAVVELGEAPKFKGKVTANGKKLSDLLQAVAGMSTPPPLAQSFSAGGDIVASAKDLSVKGLSLALGGIRADGDLTAAYGGTPATFALKLTAPRIDVDALLAPPEAPAPAGGGSATVSAPVPEKADGAAAASLGEGIVLPAAVNGTIELSAPTVTYRGGIISDARLDAELNNGEITVSQLSAQLPGGSDLFAVGVFSADKGKPRFDGNVDARVSDLRRVMMWLGIEAPDVASDRLRNATFKGRVVADSSQVQGTNLDVVLDSSRISGGVTVALRSRPAFGASILVDRLNLDAYLASDGTAEKAAGAGANGAAKAGEGAKPAESQGGDLAFLNVLGRFDANLRLQVERMTYRQVPLSGLAFDGTLFTGNLEVRKLAIGDLAGASGTFSGSVNGLGGVPALKGGRFDIRGLDVDRLARQFEMTAPVSTRDIGVIAMTGGLEGPILRPQVDVVAKAPEASLDVKGRLSIIPLEPLFAGDVKIRHTDLQRFLRVLGIDYRPSGRLGGFGLVTGVKADAKQVTLTQMNGKVGPVALEGTLTVDLSGPRPRLTGSVKTGRIVVDPFLPAKRSAALMDGGGAGGPSPRVIPAAWVPSAPSAGQAAHLWLVAATTGHWPTDPLDLSALGTFDADLKLASDAVIYDGIALNGVAADAAITEGTLRVGALTATLFGGALKGNAVVRSAPQPAVDGSLSLSGADFGAAEQELRGKRLATGDIAFRLNAASTGRSVAALIGGLKGEGSFEVKKVALAADSGKSSLGPISGLVAGLNDLAGLLAAGDKRPEGLADVMGSFRIDNGIARSEDFQFVSNVGEGKAKGAVDLPNWRMKVEGDIQLSQNLFAQLLSGTTGLNLTLPFRIEGDLTEPNVVLDTGKLPGKALSIPGAILDKTGVGKILRKLIPPASQ